MRAQFYFKIQNRIFSVKYGSSDRNHAFVISSDYNAFFLDPTALKVRERAHAGLIA
jgi:hypothetical protein